MWRCKSKSELLVMMLAAANLTLGVAGCEMEDISDEAALEQAVSGEAALELEIHEPSIVDAREILAQHSGKCLDVAGASLGNGADVIQWDCWGGGNQKWELQDVGGGYYNIVAQHSRKCLDVAGASLGNGADVIQWDCWGGGNQKWELQDVGDGYYNIVAQHSRKCLDVAGASLANGGNVIQWDCWGGGNQKWRLR